MKLFAAAICLLCCGCGARKAKVTAPQEGRMVFSGCKPTQTAIYECTFVCLPVGAYCKLPNIEVVP